MGLRYRKSVKICKGIRLNFSKSGVSTSIKIGNVTYNNKRGTTVNLGHGFSYHVGKSSTSKTKRRYKPVENQWNKINDKQIKIYNIIMKIILWMFVIVMGVGAITTSLILMPVAIGFGIIAYKFDAKAFQTKTTQRELFKEEVSIIDTDTLNNDSLLSKEEIIIPKYEIINDCDLNKYSKVYSSEYIQTFNDISINGYRILEKDIDVVGGWYRKENINEFINSIKYIENPELDILLEKEPHNEYDKNAIRVDAVYKVNEEIRKLQIGYISKENAYELRDINDLKASLLNLTNIGYKTTINIWINENKYKKLIEDKEAKLRQQEEYNKELENIEKKSKIAYEYNQLAKQLEKEGDIYGAIENYEKCIELKFEGNYPYDRLAILYRKIKDYDNEIRVLNQAIELFEFLEKATARIDISAKLEKFKIRLNRANELKDKKSKKSV